MIKTYSEFNDHMIKMAKIRAANYAETDCDINTILESIYSDIQNEILFDTYRQEHTVEEGETVITILNFDNSSTADATEMYEEVLDIVNEDNYSILKMFEKLNNTQWQWKKPYRDCGYSDGDVITFIRKKTVPIENLNPVHYQKLIRPALEGLTYYIQTSIPNQVDGQFGNYSYQRYFNAMKKLTDSLPQYIFNTTESNKWL